MIRTTNLPRTHLRLALLAGSLLLGAACDGDGPVRPVPPASLEAQGELGFACDLNCDYEGEAVNVGNGCANNVRGVTRLLNSSGGELDSDDWALDPARTIAVDESFLYGDCCFTAVDRNAMSSYRTDIFWDDVPCA